MKQKKTDEDEKTSSEYMVLMGLTLIGAGILSSFAPAIGWGLAAQNILTNLIENDKRVVG